MSETMNEKKILSMLNVAVTKMEQKFVRETGRPVNKFYTDFPSDSKTPLGSIVV